jgi:hypothetical protein
VTQDQANALIAKYKGKVPGVMNFRDRLWIFVHEPSGAEVAFTDYNQEITGHTEDASAFPELGECIRYAGNAYYVVGEANRRPGFVTIDGGTNE